MSGRQSLTELLNRIERAGIRLWVDDERLRYDASEGAMTPALREELIEHLRRAAAIEADRPRLTPRATKQDPPPSFSQERLWFIDQLGADAGSYIRIAERLIGSLDIAALRRALEVVVERHEVLRTTFQAVGGRPVQRIAPSIELPFEEIDLGHLDRAERDRGVRDLIAEEVVRTFDLARGPLFRVWLYRFEDDDHVLVVTAHPTVFDAASVGVFKRELSAAYHALVTRAALPADALPVQYADFAVWQRKWLEGETLDTMVDCWRERLQDLPVVEFPTDRARPAVQSFEGAEQRFEVPSDLYASVVTLGRERDATPATTLLAAFAVLLGRYADGEEVVVGLPVENRSDVSTRDLIGPFANTLVFRSDLAGDPKFVELLERVRNVVVDAHDSPDVPFELLAAELASPSEPSPKPLFQITFAFQNVPADDLVLPGVSVEPFDLGAVTTRFDLELRLTPTASGLSGRVVYSPHLFDAPTMERIAEHYRHLLEAVVADPEGRLSTLLITGKTERRSMIALGRGARTDYPERPVHELFEDQAEARPDAVALVDGDLRWTYGECNRQANRIAHHLQRLGVGPEVPVGIHLGRSAQAILAMLGVLKAGGAYLPLDPSYPRKRLALMLSDTQIPVLLTQGALAGELPDTSAEVIDLDQLGSTLRPLPDSNPSSGASPDTLAYIIYTSGSTGRPKGSCIVHRGIVRLVRGADYVDLGPDEVFLQFAPLSFDASTFEIWGSLLNGAKLVVFSPHTPSLEELGRAIEDNGVTTLWLTAALFRLMVDHQIGRLGGVRQLLAGGETLSAPHVRKMIDTLEGDRSIINGYGPTENTTFTCCHRMSSGYRFEGSVPIGRPIANTDVYVLDRCMNPAPLGIPGRLYIGGAGLAVRYLNRPELTAERFVPNPFGEPGDRLYDTGDLVQWTAEGTVEFIGRVDHQVKIRGFRIELGEIESVLESHPTVRQGLVIVRVLPRASPSMWLPATSPSRRRTPRSM